MGDEIFDTNFWTPSNYLPSSKFLEVALSRATGRLVGLSFEYEFGILKPWSVGEGVEAFEFADSDCGEGLSEPFVPPEG